MRVTFRLIIVFVSLLGLLGGKSGAAQEFNCAMNINDEQLEGTYYDYVKQTLATDLASYINEIRWTETEVLEHERINCDQHHFDLRHTDYTYSAEAVISPGDLFMEPQKPPLLSDQAWQFSCRRALVWWIELKRSPGLSTITPIWCWVMILLFCRQRAAIICEGAGCSGFGAEF